MTAPRLTRREVVLIATTAVVCFAVAIPLTSASSSESQRKFTVLPGNSARFANMDWSCEYVPKQGGGPPIVICKRESTDKGLRTFMSAHYLSVFRCPTEYLLDPCKRVLHNAPRNP